MAWAEEAPGPQDPPPQKSENSEKAEGPVRKQSDDREQDAPTEITVTAPRLRDSLRSKAVSATVISREQVEKGGIQGTVDLDAYVPNLTVRDAGDRKSPFLAMRGFANNAFGDHLVTLYVDDVPHSELRSVFLDFYDVERIETYRGAQPTRFGKHSATGVIHVMTPVPGNKLEGSASASYGNYDTQAYQGAVSGPIIKDKLFFGLAGTFNKRDGYVKNLFRGSRFDHTQSFSGRAKLRARPIEDLDVRLTVEGMRADDGGQRFVLLRQPDPFKVAYDNRGKSQTDAFLASLRVQYHTPAFDLLSVTARRQYDSDHAETDLDSTPNGIFELIDEHEYTQWSQELRFSSNGAHPDWQWSAGTYFEDRDVNPQLGFASRSVGFIQGAPPAGLGLAFQAPIEQRQMAHQYVRNHAWFG